MYYECHVTLLGDPSTIKPCVERLRWRFSCIDGDPVLGDGIKCYATRHFHVRHGHSGVQAQLFAAAEQLQAWGLSVVRRKVELVVFDSRSVKVQCTGGCPECHLDDLTTF